MGSLVRGPIGLSGKAVRVELETSSLAPGSKVRGAIVLALTRPARVGNLGAALWGGEYVSVWQQDSDSTGSLTPYRHSLRATITCVEANCSIQPPKGIARVPSREGDPIDLPAGEFRFPFACALPAGLPASWSGPSVDVAVLKVEQGGFDGFDFVGLRYFIRAQVEFGRTGSLESLADFDVTGDAEAPSFQQGAAVATKRNPGRASLSVDLLHVLSSAGSVLHGTVALKGVQASRLRKVRVTLFERLEGKQAETRSKPVRWERRVLSEVTLTAPTPGEAAPLSFALPVPLATKGSRTGKIASRTHHVEARADIAFARDLKARVNVRVLPAVKRP